MAETHGVPAKQLNPLRNDRSPEFGDALNAHSRANLLRSRALFVLTAPVIYGAVILLALLDLLLGLYQAVCFSAYGVPKVKRSEYIIHGRSRLTYLNWLERLNCEYCAYANGLAAYLTEIAGRTEQFWCPIKHARRVGSPHSRYSRFVEFGDADAYRYHSKKVRRDFVDIEIEPKRPREASPE